MTRALICRFTVATGFRDPTTQKRSFWVVGLNDM